MHISKFKFDAFLRIVKIVVNHYIVLIFCALFLQNYINEYKQKKKLKLCTKR